MVAFLDHEADNAAHGIGAHVDKSQGLDFPGGGDIRGNILDHYLAGLYGDYVFLGLGDRKTNNGEGQHNNAHYNGDLLCFHECLLKLTGRGRYTCLYATGCQKVPPGQVLLLFRESLKRL